MNDMIQTANDMLLNHTGAGSDFHGCIDLPVAYDKDEFARCYDIFLTLKNKEYLEQLKAQHKARKRRYRESWGSTYGQYSGGSYSIPTSSTYSEGETALLKKFCRSLSKTYHPDLNPDEDTTEAMKLLNKLKEQWGV